MTEDWAAELRQGHPDRAWDLFLTRYRRLIFAAIRHYVRDPDDVMEVFAAACEHLHSDGMRRLRAYLDQTDHRARFTTWLVTVIHHLAVDWLRRERGRPRLSAAAERLPPLRQRIFTLVFERRLSHLEAYGILTASEAPALTFREFLRELRETYRAADPGARAGMPPEPDLSDLPGEDGPDPLDAAALTRLADRVRASLGAEDRVAVELYVVEGLPAAQVATILGLPNAKAVYNRVYRALADARERLERDGVRPDDLR